MKLFKKDTELDKVRGEIESTQTKKAYMVAAVQQEIAELDQERNSIFQNIGESLYQCHKDGSSAPSFTENYDKLDQLLGQVAEKNEKILEFTKRFDEEIALLSATLAALTAPPPPPPAPTASPASFCENCGKGMQVGDVFCQGCGTKMGG